MEKHISKKKYIIYKYANIYTQFSRLVTCFSEMIISCVTNLQNPSKSRSVGPFQKDSPL